jgi:hypothetical protein
MAKPLKALIDTSTPYYAAWYDGATNSMVSSGTGTNYAFSGDTDIGFSFICAFLPCDGTDGTIFSTLNADSASAYGCSLKSNADGSLTYKIGNGSGVYHANVTSAAASLSFHVPHIIAIRASSAGVNMRLDGVQLCNGSLVGVNGYGTASSMAIGKDAVASSGYFCGDIRYLCGYDGYVTDSVLSVIETNIIAKYITHPAASPKILYDTYAVENLNSNPTNLENNIAKDGYYDWIQNWGRMNGWVAKAGSNRPQRVAVTNGTIDSYTAYFNGTDESLVQNGAALADCKWMHNTTAGASFFMVTTAFNSGTAILFATATTTAQIGVLFFQNTAYNYFDVMNGSGIPHATASTPASFFVPALFSVRVNSSGITLRKNGVFVMHAALVGAYSASNPTYLPTMGWPAAGYVAHSCSYMAGYDGYMSDADTTTLETTLLAKYVTNTSFKSPAMYGTLQAGYEMDDPAITVTSGKIETWPNRYNPGTYDVTQATAENRPIYNASGAWSGKPDGQYAGGGAGYLGNTTLLTPSGNDIPVTVAYSYKAVLPASAYYFKYGWSGTSTQLDSYISSASTDIFLRKSAGTPVDNDSGVAKNTNKAIDIRSHTGIAETYYHNGTKTLVSTASDVNSTTFTSFTIGACLAASTYSYIGRIGCFYVYSNALSDAACLGLNQCIINKGYGY